jgi:hypothetical protein
VAAARLQPSLYREAMDAWRIRAEQWVEGQEEGNHRQKWLRLRELVGGSRTRMTVGNQGWSCLEQGELQGFPREVQILRQVWEAG